MTLAIRLAIRGKLSDYEKAFREAYAVAATATMRRKTTQLVNNQKSYIARRLGTPISKAVRGQAYPKSGNALQPASEVNLGATRQTNNGLLNIIGLFQTGATVVPRNAKYLWVPTPEGRRLGGGPRNKPRALTPATFRGGRLLFLPIKGRSRNARVPARLVLRDNPRVTVFVAVRRVRIRPKLQRLVAINTQVWSNYMDIRNRALGREIDKRVKKIR